MMMSFPAVAQETAKGLASIHGGPFYPGDLIFLELEVSVPKGAEVQFPEEHPAIRGLEAFKSAFTQNTIEKGKQVLLTRSYAYIALDSVTGTTGTIPVHYTADGKDHTIQLEGNAFQVIRVPADTTGQLRAAYGPVQPPAPSSWWIVLLSAGALLVVTILSIAIRQWLKKRKKLSIPADADPLEWALSQLQALGQSIPFTERNHKAHWSRMADIVRLYIEKVWEIPAQFLSTEELLEILSRKEQYQAIVQDLEMLLRQSDLIKFAKEKTGQDIQRDHIELARKIVSARLPLNSPVKEGGVHV